MTEKEIEGLKNMDLCSLTRAYIEAIVDTIKASNGLICRSVAECEEIEHIISNIIWERSIVPELVKDGVKND